MTQYICPACGSTADAPGRCINPDCDEDLLPLDVDDLGNPKAGLEAGSYPRSLKEELINKPDEPLDVALQEEDEY